MKKEEPESEPSVLSPELERIARKVAEEWFSKPRTYKTKELAIEALAEVVGALRLKPRTEEKDEKLNIHIITGPNGRCMCGFYDGRALGCRDFIQERWSKEIQRLELALAESEQRYIRLLAKTIAEGEKVENFVTNSTVYRHSKPEGVPNIDTQRLRIAWEAGIKLARGYCDNIIHLQGEQKERQWQKFLSGLTAIDNAMGVPTPKPVDDSTPLAGGNP